MIVVILVIVIIVIVIVNHMEVGAAAMLQFAHIALESGKRQQLLLHFVRQRTLDNNDCAVVSA